MRNIRPTLSVLSILVGFSFLHSCRPSPLETSLEQAGKNRTELEEVLTHFSRLPEDSLKYKAARFLIENMPGHTALANPKVAAHFDSLQQNSTRAD